MSRVLKRLLKEVPESAEPVVQPGIVTPAASNKRAFLAVKIAVPVIALTIGAFAYHLKTHPTLFTRKPASKSLLDPTPPAGLNLDQLRENQDTIKLYYAGNYDEALKRFTKLSQANPTSVSLLVNLAMVQRKKGAIAEAKKQNIAALNINPRSAIAHNNLGALNAEEKNWDEAIKMFEASLKDDEKLADTYLNLGNAYEQKAKWADARLAYTAYLAHPSADAMVKRLLKKRVIKLTAMEVKK